MKIYLMIEQGPGWLRVLGPYQDKMDIEGDLLNSVKSALDVPGIMGERELSDDECESFVQMGWSDEGTNVESFEHDLDPTWYLRELDLTELINERVFG